VSTRRGIGSEQDTDHFRVPDGWLSLINMGSTMANTNVKALVLRRQGETDSLGQEVLVQRVEELLFDGEGQDKGQLLDWVDRMVSL